MESDKYKISKWARGKIVKPRFFFDQLSEQIFVILDGYEETTEKDITQFCEQLALIFIKI